MRPAKTDMIAPASQPNSRFHVIMEGLLRVLVVLAAITVIGFGVVERWRLARALPWQTDELPLLMRFTGACGHVNSEESARTFEPSAFTLRTGTLRALQPPQDAAALHTTTNFWTNLWLYVGGVKPWSARLMPFAFAVATIVVIACATRVLGGGLSAVAIAVGLAALSPLNIMYAAQARGYAEAMFLTPLLLLGMDSLRRHPRTLFRAALVLFVALQLSLTVYTMWLFWVLPTLLVATIWLPREIVERETARQVRFTLGMIVIALVVCMGVYTMDRWSALTFTAGHMGEPFNDLAAILDFAAEVARALTPLEELAAIPAFLGLVIVLRSHRRWWGIAMACSLFIPLSLALALGSAGYARNFAYLLGPVAMLAGLGIERFLIALLERRHRVLVHATAAVLLLAGMLAAWDGTVHDVRAMCLPNWGGAIQMLNARPEIVGPRWISPCLAHHWPINWYREPDTAGRVVDAPDHQTIELFVGTTFNGHGAEIIYQADTTQQAIVEAAAPIFITRNADAERMYGVNLRRWLARPEISEGPPAPPGNNPYWIYWLDDGANTSAWSEFIKHGSASDRFVSFKPVSFDGRLLRTMIVDGPHFVEIIRSLQAGYVGRPFRPRIHALTPLPSSSRRDAVRIAQYFSAG